MFSPKKLDVVQITNLSKIRLLYSKGMIANRLNQSDCISKRAISNSSATKTSLKFDGPRRQITAQRINNQNKQ